MKKNMGWVNSFALISLLVASSVCQVVAMPSSETKTTEKKSPLGIVLVAFGTSTDAGERAYGPIEKAVRAAYPGASVRRAYTSNIIRKKLAAQGKKTLSVDEALDQLQKEKVSRVAIQSLHVAVGAEFEEMLCDINRFQTERKKPFTQIYIGRPLIESRQDINSAIRALRADMPAERKPEDGVVFMGHGNNSGQGDTTYLAIGAELQRHDPKMFLGTVEGALEFGEISRAVQSVGIKRVWLQPMMIVAGDHAINDLAGDEPDSWKNMFAKIGVSAQPRLRGLGEVPGIPDIFVKHLQKAIEKSH